MKLANLLLFLSSSCDRRVSVYRDFIESSSYRISVLFQSIGGQVDSGETDIIFSSAYGNHSSSASKVKSRGSILTSSHPDMFYVHLAYDHLATSSLKAIESLPSIKFIKGDDFLNRWWLVAKKWNLLGDELLALEENEESDVSIRSLNNDSAKSGYKNNRSDVPVDSLALNDSQRKPIRVPLKSLHSMSLASRARVLCVGDVHGCLDELCDLLRHVNYKPWDTVLLLGDLVAKGPNSVGVVRLAMEMGALAVRGNHDHEVIKQCKVFNVIEPLGIILLRYNVPKTNWEVQIF